MQKDQPEIEKISQNKRLRNAFTPGRVRRNAMDTTVTNVRSIFHHRATMSSRDFALPQSTARRKIALDRTSIAPNQTFLAGTKLMDNDNSDVELKLLYDEYLQKIMTEIILKKRAKEKEELFLSKLAKITKEYNESEEKLFKLKTRERDIINLTNIQNVIDSQIVDLNNCIRSEDAKMLERTLSQLHNLLQPYDKFRCNNIILPETPEEWEETFQALQSCSATLKSIMDLIGSKAESYQAANSGIKEFLETFNNIEDYRKRLEKEVDQLGALVLKTASLNLMEPDN